MAATPETYTRTIRTMNEVLDVLRDQPDRDGALTVLAETASRSSASGSECSWPSAPSRGGRRPGSGHTQRRRFAERPRAALRGRLARRFDQELRLFGASSDIR